MLGFSQLFCAILDVSGVRGFDMLWPIPTCWLSENRIYPPGYGIFIGKMDEHGDNPLDLEVPYLETDMSHWKHPGWLIIQRGVKNYRGKWG